jgi:hypothetical protein
LDCDIGDAAGRQTRPERAERKVAEGLRGLGILAMDTGDRSGRRDQHEEQSFHMWRILPLELEPRNSA